MKTLPKLPSGVLLLAGLALLTGGVYAAFNASGAAEDQATASASETIVPSPDLPTIQVFKSPACGCCSLWTEHLRRAGFPVDEHDVVDLQPIKVANGVSAGLQACHTALVDGYVVEGHVPAEDILRLLEQRPRIAGIAVPGMPIGSPGMEMGDRHDTYDVLTFDGSGRTTVWASH